MLVLKRDVNSVFVARTYYTVDIISQLSLSNKALLTYLIYRGWPALNCYVR